MPLVIEGIRVIVHKVVAAGVDRLEIGVIVIDSGIADSHLDTGSRDGSGGAGVGSGVGGDTTDFGHAPDQVIFAVGLNFDIGLDDVDGGVLQEVLQGDFGNGGRDRGDDLEGGVDRSPGTANDISFGLSRSLIETDDHPQVLLCLRGSSEHSPGCP
jgi:hypothetical protein